MSETKLKPCPFCGGEAHKRIVFPVDPDGMEMNMYIVGCKTCDIEFSWLWDEECAIELWNNRPIEDEIREKAIDEFSKTLKREVLEEICDTSERQKNYEVGSDMSITCSHIMGALRDVYHRIIESVIEKLKSDE